MNFRVVTKDVHTNLIVNLKKKEIININQFRFLQDLSSEAGFLKPIWTSAGNTNKLCFDISGLMSLYEYLKTTISQDDYFQILMKIQRCLDYCQKNNMHLGNVVCSSKNIYYNSVSGQIWFVYVPLNSEINKYSIIDFLLNDVDKNAHIIISDIATLEEYRRKLFECRQMQKQNKSKNKNSFFSADKLYNILYELRTNQNMNSCKNIPLADDSALKMDEKYRVTMPPAYTGGGQQNVISGTVPAIDQNIKTSDTIPAAVFDDDRPQAFLVSRTDGKRIRIQNVPFFIGRTGENDLVLSGNEKISANHAVIDYKNDCYFIRDTGRDNKGSTNGTFVSNQRIEPMKEIKIKNGDAVSFYKDKYNFIVEGNADSTENLDENASSDKDTHSTDTEEKYTLKVGYIRNITDGKIHNIFSYPYADKIFPGIHIEKQPDNSIYIYNISCGSLTIEDKMIKAGERFEMFSGCAFSIDNNKYRFYIGS